jgi:ubiquinone/menaquinone biosynthesis C-methylase UbiE
MTDTLVKLAYETVQQSKSYFGLVHKLLSRQVMEWVAPLEDAPQGVAVPATLVQKIQDRMQALLEEDWQDAEAGVYPANLLFDSAWNDFLTTYPLICLDIPLIWLRARDKQFKDFPQTVNLTDYPNYYTQNFHYQTDGYLSDRSAQIYDLQVELLFNGGADPMRRRILKPLKAALANSTTPPRQQRILDLACGTGRTMRMLRGAFPQASLYGSDLSPAYLRRTNELLSQLPGELPQLTQANAEALPYPDNYFHGVSCVFLFHELPAPVRQKVIQEAYRVTQPGGVFLICDSIQTLELPELAPIMENFQRTFHEPFYRNYIEDDLSLRLQTAGFQDVRNFDFFMSKYWVAVKPS